MWGISLKNKNTRKIISVIIPGMLGNIVICFSFVLKVLSYISQEFECALVCLGGILFMISFLVIASILPSNYTIIKLIKYGMYFFGLMIIVIAAVYLISWAIFGNKVLDVLPYYKV